MISSEASIMAVARFAFDTSVLDTLSNVCRNEGNTSLTQCAILFVGSGWFRSLARWHAEYARSRFSRLGLSTATITGQLVTSHGILVNILFGKTVLKGFSGQS